MRILNADSKAVGCFMTVASLVMLLVACAGSPQDPSPPPPLEPTPATVQTACIDRITCLDGSEYCCITAACMLAKCEPPRWDSNTCTCHH